MKSIILAVMAFVGLASVALAQPPVSVRGIPPQQGPGGIHGIIIRHQCGGFAGLRCGPGQYCQMPTGVCNRPDASGTCQPRPRICTRIYAPVCGCDGQTYANACEAAANGASVAHRGRCRGPIGIIIPPGHGGVVAPNHPIGVVVHPAGPGIQGVPVDRPVVQQRQP